MITILVGTDREGSRSKELADIVQKAYSKIQVESRVMELNQVGLDEIRPRHYAEAKPQKMAAAIDTLMDSDGLHLIVPEYNGSMPGALKHFIDHWKFPDSFEHRPVCFVGLGGRFGGLRPVEHLQQVFGYRNAFIFPDRVFIMNVWNVLKDGAIIDDTINELLGTQVQGFSKFIQALKSENLHGKAKF